MAFSIEVKDKYILVILADDSNQDDEVLFKQRIEFELNKAPIYHIIVDGSTLKNFSDKIASVLAFFSRELKKKDKKAGVRLTKLSQKMLLNIKSKGLDSALPNFNSVKGALIDAGLESQSKGFDVNLLNPFITATLKVLEIQGGLKAKFDKPYLKKNDDPHTLGDVSGVIPLKSETFEGTLAISLSEKVFKSIYEKMLGEPCTEINRENVDMVGEFSNIIMGQAKAELNQHGYDIQMALPSCIWGKDHQVKQFGDSTCMVIPFQCDVGPVYIEISTKSVTVAKSAKAA